MAVGECKLCPWHLETSDPEDDFVDVMQAVITVHVALRHPAEFERALGKSAKEALAHYRRTYGDRFARLSAAMEKEGMPV